VREAELPGPASAQVERIEELEREYRRLRRFTTTLLIAVAVLLGLAVAFVAVSARHGMPDTVAQVVAARQFVLRGEDGAIRGVWGTQEGGAIRFVLQDGAGRARAKLDLLADGASGLTFADSAGHPRAVFAFLPDQTASLVLADQAGKTRSVLGISAEGDATILFADRNGTTRAGLGVDGRGAGTFTLTDRGGRDVMQPEPEAADSADTTQPAPETPAPPRRR
jgi:hypothetical protein